MAREDFDLFYEQPSRWPRIIFFLTLFAILVGGAWVFAPPLMATYAPGLSAKIETSLPQIGLIRQIVAPRQAIEADAEPQAITVSAAQPTVIREPKTTAAAPAEAPAAREEAEPALPGPPPVIAAPASAPPLETTAASTIPSPWPPALVPEPAGAPVVVAAPPEPVGTLVNVPLPRKRPSLTIASRTVIPLPRPRPELPTDGPTPEQISSELQVDRLR